MNEDERYPRTSGAWAAAGTGFPHVGDAPDAQPAEATLRAVVLVEGMSDRNALVALARRRRRDLGSEGIAVKSIGGAGAIARSLREWGPQGRNLRLAGMCDAAEMGDFQRGLAGAGLGSGLTREGMEALGFYLCVADLEDELIRCLGVSAVEEVLDAHGDLGSFRIFQAQPAQRRRRSDEQLRRFLGTRSGRKIAYAGFLVDALDLAHVPRPLDGVLAHV